MKLSYKKTSPGAVLVYGCTAPIIGNPKVSMLLKESKIQTIIRKTEVSILLEESP